eukprot:Opistho-1_new@81020
MANLVAALHLRPVGAAPVEQGGEELLGRRDGDRRSAVRQREEEVADFDNLEASAVLDPRLLQQSIVLVLHVDDRNALLRYAVQNASRRVQKHRLEGTNGARKLARCRVGIDVERLAARLVLRKATNDGNSAGSDDLVHAIDLGARRLAHELPLAKVQELRLHDALEERHRCDATSTECGGERLILTLEDLPRGFERGLVCDAHSVNVLWLNTRGLKHLVQLWTAAVHDDRCHSHAQEGEERIGEDVEFLLNNCTADLHDSDMAGRVIAPEEVVEILDVAAARHSADYAGECRPVNRTRTGRVCSAGIDRQARTGACRQGKASTRDAQHAAVD